MEPDGTDNIRPGADESTLTEPAAKVKTEWKFRTGFNYLEAFSATFSAQMWLFLVVLLISLDEAAVLAKINCASGTLYKEGEARDDAATVGFLLSSDTPISRLNR